MHKDTIRIEQQLERGGEVVAQREAEKLLPVEGRPSGEVTPAKGRPYRHQHASAINCRL